MAAVADAELPESPAKALDHRASFVFAYQLSPPSPALLAETAERYHAHLRGMDRASLWNALDWHRHVGSPQAGQRRYLWQPIGREAARALLHPDLLPVVDQLLHGGSDPGPVKALDADARYAGHAPMSLQKEAIDSRFWIQLGSAAKARMDRLGLREPTTDLGAMVDDVRLYTFASGIVLVAVDLRIIDLADANAALPLAIVEEAVYALSHAAERRPRQPVEKDRPPLLSAVQFEHRVVLEDLSVDDDVVFDRDAGHGVRRATELEKVDATHLPLRLLRAVKQAPGKQLVLLAGARAAPLDLNELANALTACVQPANTAAAAGAGKPFADLRKMVSRQQGRIFTYVAAVCDGRAPVAALDEAAYRLSRRFTLDYALDRSEVAASVLHPFDNVRHAMATQGGALIVRSSGAEFVRQFVRTAARPTYLPLALLSYHEYLLLLHLTQGCVFVPDPAHPEDDKEHVQTLRYDLAKFRLYFRFAHVSDIAHHNQVNDEWRRAFHLDRLLQDLSLDVREADHVLERHHREQQLRRWRLYGAVGGGLTGFIGIHEIGEALRHQLAPDHEALLIALQQRPDFIVESQRAFHFAHLWHGAVLALALAAAAAFAWVAWRKGPRLEE